MSAHGRAARNKAAAAARSAVSARALTAKMVSHHLPEKGHTPLPRKRITIGEVAASAQPLMIQTLLGSCVAVCLHDPGSKVGGMNHILLPSGSKDDQASRFGVHAMELLINEIMRLGGNRKGLVAKAFGAANVLACLQAPTAGDRNAQFVRRFLAAEGIPLLAQRLGGVHAVQINFRSDTGKTLLHSVDGSPLSKVIAEEETYLRSGQNDRQTNDVITLF